MPTPISKLLTDNDRKEQLSKVYLRAVAAACGFTTSEPELDRDSIDLIVMSGSSRRASVGFQLKATSSPHWDGNELVFQLKQKNFNDLTAKRQSPALLAVMEIPASPDDWLRISQDELVLKRCMWWLSLVGLQQTQQGSKQVRIPRANMVSVEALTELIEKSDRNEL